MTEPSMKPELLVIWPNRPRQMAMLESAYQLHRYDQSADPEQLLETVGDRISAVITSGVKGLSRHQINQLPNLKIVASTGVGYDSIDIAACKERGIQVTYTPGLMTDDVADTAIGLILATRRGLVAGDQWVRNGNWLNKGMMPLTSTIRGKQLGIVGLGRIGQAIAARALPMGLKISYCGPNKKQNLPFDYIPDLINLAAWADILVITCPGGERNEGLIGSKELKALGAHGTLINVSRGSVVDQAALVEALISRSISSAGLDVFAEEPHCDEALKALENLVMYPHHASGTEETRDAMAQLVVDNLNAFFNGKPLLTPIC